MEGKIVTLALIVAAAVFVNADSGKVGPTQMAYRKTASYLDCKKCFGHGYMVTPDPRCRFGCDKNMTYPDTHPTPTTPFGNNTEPTEPVTTPITPTPITDYSEEPELFNEESEEDNGSNDEAQKSKHSANPMMKLVPRIGLDMVPLLTKKQMKEYEETVQLIKFLKQRQLLAGQNVRTSTNIWFIVSICLICFLVALVSITIVGYCVVKRSKISRTIPFTIYKQSSMQTI